MGIDRGLPFPLADIATADVIRRVGAQSADTMPPAMQWFDDGHSRGAAHITIDPRRFPTARGSELQLQPVPGSLLRELRMYVHCAYKWEEAVMSRDTADQRAARQCRINLRASARQEQLLKQAAAATDRTMTDFVLETAVVEAERVLADRRWFLIDDERWDQFQRLLDQPARDLPKLRALLIQPSPFADED